MATSPVTNRYAKQMRFLAALARGETPADGATLAGVPLATFYTWRRKHSRFRASWKRAVAYAQTPPFPPAAQLAAMRRSGPRTFWGESLVGLLEREAMLEAGDRVAMIESRFKGEETVNYYTILPGGEWREDSRRSIHQPPPEGIEWPNPPIPLRFEALLPPRPAPESPVPERDIAETRRTDAP